MKRSHKRTFASSGNKRCHKVGTDCANNISISLLVPMIVHTWYSVTLCPLNIQLETLFRTPGFVSPLSRIFYRLQWYLLYLPYGLRLVALGLVRLMLICNVMPLFTTPPPYPTCTLLTCNQKGGGERRENIASTLGKFTNDATLALKK